MILTARRVQNAIEYLLESKFSMNMFLSISSCFWSFGSLSLFFREFWNSRDTFTGLSGFPQQHGQWSTVKVNPGEPWLDEKHWFEHFLKALKAVWRRHHESALKLLNDNNLIRTTRTVIHVQRDNVLTTILNRCWILNLWSPAEMPYNKM